VVRVDDARQRCFVGFGADVGRLRPGELVGRDALARLSHAREAKIRAVGQNCCEQGVRVVVPLVRAQVIKRGGEPGLARDFVEQLGNPHAGHQGVDPARQRIDTGIVGAHRRDRQLAGIEGHAFDLATCEAVREALQPPVELARAIGDPFVRRRGQFQIGGDRRDLGCRQEIPVEASVVRRAFDPHVAPDRRAHQGRHCGRARQGQAAGTAAARSRQGQGRAQLVEAGLSPTEAARQLGLGRATVYREMALIGVRRPLDEGAKSALPGAAL
jgi:hypothetical protein